MLIRILRDPTPRALAAHEAECWCVILVYVVNSQSNSSAFGAQWYLIISPICKKSKKSFNIEIDICIDFTLYIFISVYTALDGEREPSLVTHGNS